MDLNALCRTLIGPGRNVNGMAQTAIGSKTLLQVVRHQYSMVSNAALEIELQIGDDYVRNEIVGTGINRYVISSFTFPQLAIRLFQKKEVGSFDPTSLNCLILFSPGIFQLQQNYLRLRHRNKTNGAIAIRANAVVGSGIATDGPIAIAVITVPPPI
jgi:hypothetical protein